jgi:hypothetical protein
MNTSVSIHMCLFACTCPLIVTRWSFSEFERPASEGSGAVRCGARWRCPFVTGRRRVSRHRHRRCCGSRAVCRWYALSRRGAHVRSLQLWYLQRAVMDTVINPASRVPMWPGGTVAVLPTLAACARGGEGSLRCCIDRCTQGGSGAWWRWGGVVTHSEVKVSSAGLVPQVCRAIFFTRRLGQLSALSIWPGCSLCGIRVFAPVVGEIHRVSLEPGPYLCSPLRGGLQDRREEIG